MLWIGIGAALIGVSAGWMLAAARTRAALTDTLKALSADALMQNNQAFLQLATATLERFQQGARADLGGARAGRGGAGAAAPRLVAARRRGARRHGKESHRQCGGAQRATARPGGNTDSDAARRETAALVKALRQPAVRGRWGEMQLHRVVEMAGMLEHCDFLEQPTRVTQERSLRPDLIVRLPGGKQIVIDAKAPAGRLSGGSRDKRR